MASPTAIYLFILRLLNIIKDLPAKEISKLTKKFKDFKGALFKQPLPKKKYSKVNQWGKISAKITKRATNVAKHIPTQLSSNIKLSHFLIQNKEPADKVDKGIKEDKEDKQQPFNKPSVLYNEVLGGLEDKVVILKAGEDNNSWLNNAESHYLKSRYLSHSINPAERRVLELEGPILN
ncbi:hypothetical protein V2W45_1464996 [Cenococcum geophilum]